MQDMDDNLNFELNKKNIKNYSLNKYLEVIDRYKHKLIKDRYNVILEFINNVFQIKLKSLTEINNFNLSIKDESLKNNIKKFNKYFRSFFYQQFLITRNDIKYFDYIIKKLLSSIGYKLIKNNNNYSIKIK